MELISREEVKTIIECTIGYHASIKDAFDRVMELPIIESRPKGKWIIDEEDNWKEEVYSYACTCSLCGEWEVFRKDAEFCPHCGADMRGE